MDIIINGKTSAGDFTNINDLLNTEELDPKLVVVEVNGNIVPKAEYAALQLKQGDVVEIIQFVAGG